MTGFAVKDELLDAQTLRAASAALFGGADIVECIEIARRVHGTDLDGWHEAWHRAGETAYSLAVTAEAAGQAETARLAFLRACTYFRTAGLMLLEAPVDVRLVDSGARQRDAFRRAIAHFRTPVRPIEIPFEGITLPGYHFRAADDGARRATVILVNGYDGTVEESYFLNAQAALDRGYDVVAFDGPGQGSVLVEQGVPLRPDWETLISIRRATGGADADPGDPIIARAGRPALAMIRDAVDGLTPNRRASSSRPRRSVRRRCSRRAVIVCDVVAGCERWRDERSSNPAGPSRRYRDTQRWTHCRETPSSLATCETGRPDSTRWTRIRRPASASRALRWTMRRPSLSDVRHHS